MCVQGGIPPVSVPRDRAGGFTCCLVLDDHGGAMPEALRAFVGEGVRVTGDREVQGGTVPLLVTAQGVRRL